MKNDNGSSGSNGSHGGDVRNGAARDLLTVEQPAGYLQLSCSSIRSYMRQGKLKGFRIAGKRKVLIPRAELLALLEPARWPDQADDADATADALSATRIDTRRPAAQTLVGPIK